jgi:hypothetical protein
MRTRTKALLSALSVGALGTVAALGVFGAFSATTQNAGNEITTGTVALSDNDTGQALFSINNAEPGDTWTRCIRVTYTGSVEAEVRSYMSQANGSLLPYLRVLSERGTQTGTAAFPSCEGFTPDPNATPVETPIPPMTGTWEFGSVVSSPTGAATWQPGDSIVTRITMRLTSETPNSAQGATTGVSTVYWEARNVS